MKKVVFNTIHDSSYDLISLSCIKMRIPLGIKFEQGLPKNNIASSTHPNKDPNLNAKEQCCSGCNGP